jgi:hypothetical protein
MYYFYVEIEYVASGFSPARTEDLAVNLLRLLLYAHGQHMNVLKNFVYV